MLSSLIAFLIGFFGLGGVTLGGPTLTVPQGGTGTSSVPANYVLMGLNGNRITAVSTSSLGIQSGGTPGGSDTQIQFNDGGAFGGDADFTWTSASNILSVPLIENLNDDDLPYIDVAGAISVGYDAAADDSENGRGINFTAQDGGPTLGEGGPLEFYAGSATAGDSNGGMVTFRAGLASGAGTHGRFRFYPKGGTAGNGILDFDALTVARIFTFPDASGTLCLTSTCGGFSTTSAAYFASVGLAHSTTSTAYQLSLIDKGYFFSTTSASFWASAGLGFSTTSANYWSSVGLGHSTTSVAAQLAGTNTIGTLNLTNDLTVANGGTGVSTLTGVAIGNGTSAFTAGSAQTCTNQFIRAMSASYVATCASINNADWSGTDLSVANGGTGLSTFGGTNHILYTTAADTLSSEAAFTYAPSTDILTAVNAIHTGTASTTILRVPFSATDWWDIRASANRLNIATGTPATSVLFSAHATSGSLVFGPRALAPASRGFYHFTDHDGTRPCLGWIGNDGGDTDWMACRIADNDATSDDPLGFGPTTASTTVPTTYNFRMYPNGVNGFSSTTPSFHLGGNIFASSTLIMSGQFSVAIASSTTNTAHRIINWDSGNTQRIILAQNTTIDINSTSSQPRDGAKYILDFCQDGTGSRTLTWAGSKTPIWQIWGGTSTILATANTMSSFAMTYDGRTGTYTMRAFATSSDVRACVP